MSNKKLLNLFTVLLFFGIIIYSGYRVYQNGLEEEKKENAKTGKQVTPRIDDEDDEENDNGYVIISRVTYTNNNKKTIRIYSNGVVERSIILDETVASDSSKEKFSKIGNLTEGELNSLIEIISKLKEETLKRENFSESYGISIRLQEKDKILYSAEYFSEENVNKIYNIINKY